MKLIFKINNKIFSVRALTEKRAEEKAKKIIKENIFDPYGSSFSLIKIKGNKVTETSVTLLSPFEDSIVFDIISLRP